MFLRAGSKISLRKLAIGSVYHPPQPNTKTIKLIPVIRGWQYDSINELK